MKDNILIDESVAFAVRIIDKKRTKEATRGEVPDSSPGGYALIVRFFLSIFVLLRDRNIQTDQ